MSNQVQNVHVTAPIRSRARDVIALAVVFSSNLLIWFLFQPALMSPDSLTQYEEAMTLVFSDWHPPLPAIILSGFMRLGGGIGSLMFVQCMVFGFGVYFLAREITRGPLSALLVYLVLLALPPLCFYMMTFWKDSWIAAAFLWGGILGLRAAKRPMVSAGIGSAASVLICFIRDNAAVFLPWIGFILWMFQGFRARRALLLILPLAAYLLLRAGIYAAFRIEPVDKVTTLKVYELAAVCHTRPDVAALIPYSRDVVAPLFQGPGDFFDRIFFYGYSFPCDEARVAADYRTLVFRAPLALAAVKLISFSNMLGREKTTLWHLNGLDRNRFGLSMNESMAPLRDRIVEASRRLAGYRWARILLATHRVWFSLNIAWITGMLMLFARTRNPDHRWFAVLFAFPLLYYFSYLATSPAPDFRYMYPASFLIQVISLAAAAALVRGRMAARRDIA